MMVSGSQLIVPRLREVEEQSPAQYVGGFMPRSVKNSRFEGERLLQKA